VGRLETVLQEGEELIVFGAGALSSIEDTLFLYEGIDWFRWLVGFWFFLLGLFLGWWHWSNRGARKTCVELPVKLEEAQSEKEKLPFGAVFEKEPDQVDDLTKINGIGKAIGEKLNGIGFYQFSQLASLSEAQSAALSEELDLGKQIEESDWVGQAKDLVKASENSDNDD